MKILGAHMSIEGGVHKAVERGADAACDSIQLFTGSNQQWKTRPLRDEEVALFRERQVEHGVVPAVSHASYLINMASPDPELRRRSTNALLGEVDRCDLLGLPYVIIHPGAHMGSGEERAFDRIASVMNRVLRRRPGSRTKILLENTAGMGSSIGHRFDQLRAILDRLDRPDRSGVCLDTCHLFAAGYDISTEKGYHGVMEEADRAFGLERVKAFHLNDSKKGLGCRLDRHEHIGRGGIGVTAFWCLLNDERFEGIPMFLETPKGRDLREDKINLALLRAQVGRRRPVKGPTVDVAAGMPGRTAGRPRAGSRLPETDRSGRKASVAKSSGGKRSATKRSVKGIATRKRRH
jgi:deoxyribonuclease-4